MIRLKEQERKPKTKAIKGLDLVNESSLVRPLILIPSAMAFYIAATRSSQVIQTVAALAGVAGIAYAIMGGEQTKTDKDFFDDTENNKSKIDESAVQVVFSKLKTNLPSYSYCSNCCLYMKEYMELNDDSFIEVSNRYKKYLKVTLRSAIEDAWFFSCQDYIDVIARMDKLKMP